MSAVLTIMATAAIGASAILWLGWQAARHALDDWRTLRAIARNLLAEEDDRNVR